jgi:two-component system sensor histidine kinase/response regulator
MKDRVNHTGLNLFMGLGTPKWSKKQFLERELLINENQSITKQLEETTKRYASLDEKLRLIGKEHTLLEQSGHTKAQLFKTISEDIRYPLNRLKTKLTELMAADVEEADFKQAVVNLSTMVGDLFLLLENLLQWSKYQAQERQSEPQSIELTAIVADAINQQKFGAAEKHITLTNTLENNIFVYSDGEMIKSVVKTILQNAISLFEKNASVTFSGSKEADKGQLQINLHGRMPLRDLYIQMFGAKGYDVKQSNIGKSVSLGWMFCRAVIEANKGSVAINEITPDAFEIHLSLPCYNG